VLDLPRDSLQRRFGKALLHHLDMALGRAPELMECYQPPDVFDLRIDLNYEIEHYQALLFPVRRMTADLAAYLAGRDGGVQQFTLRLEHENAGWTDVDVGLLAAEREPAMLFDLTRGRLERVSIPAPVVGLRLIAKHLPPFVPAGRDLFDQTPAHAVPWEQLRERLRARLGDSAIYSLGCTADPRPERAWRKEACGTASETPPRPSWLLRRPIPLHDHELTILAGPERLESGWWDGEDARRDYYVLRTSQGQHAWAFTGIGEQGPWMLQGWFA
ncbi:MAG: DNA polymerase Y family protein, partial [Luteimonas sp.]